MSARAIPLPGGRVAYVSIPDSFPAGWRGEEAKGIGNGFRLILKGSTVQLFAAGLVISGQLQRMPSPARCDALAASWSHSFPDLESALWRGYGLAREARAASFGLLSDEMA